MNLLSYVASDNYVQIAFLALIAFIFGLSIIARGNRRREEFMHKADMETKRLNAELSVVNAKALSAPKYPNSD